MKLKNHGRNISEIEIVHISPYGIWADINSVEYFLPYKDFPWFKDATVADIHDVRLLHDRHLHWSKLDVDLELGSLSDIKKYPLIYK